MKAVEIANKLQFYKTIFLLATGKEKKKYTTNKFQLQLLLRKTNSKLITSIYNFLL